MTIEELIKEKTDGFNFEYGPNHFKVCAGAACVCRHVLKDYLKSSLEEMAQVVKQEVRQSILDKILYIGNKIPSALFNDERAKFIVLGTPHEFIIQHD